MWNWVFVYKGYAEQVLRMTNAIAGFGQGLQKPEQRGSIKIPV